MWVLLPVAGISLSLPLLIGVGSLVGFLSGVFGVGGGFLLTPMLMLMGIPATVAAASGSCQMVAASSSGAAAHFRLGNVDVKLGSILLAGGLVGAEVGVHIIKVLRTVGNADFVITVTYVVVLSGMGSYMFWDSLRTLRQGAMTPRAHKVAVERSFLDRLPFQMEFPRSQVRHSVLVPFFLCGLVGILAAIMGVGGGFIMVPMMVYLLRMPMHVAVGTDLFQILFTCAGVTYMQAATNHTVDAFLALLLALGSTVGAQVGARVSRHFRGEQLIIVLATMVLLVGAEMLSSLMLPPSSHLRPPESRTHPATPHTAVVTTISSGKGRPHVVGLPKERQICPFSCP
jgi:uncharacterized membrane protein YfcA